MTEIKSEAAIEERTPAYIQTLIDRLQIQIDLANKPNAETGTINFIAIKTLRKEHEALVSEFNKLVQKAKASQFSEEADAASEEAIKADLRAWLAKRDYSYVFANDRFWLAKSDGTWIPGSEKALAMDRHSLRGSLEKELLLEVMQEDGRWFDSCTYSFEQQDSDTLNMLRPNFVKPADGPSHWLFDTLMASLGGEKQENIEHIEKLIVAKYLHPENMKIPALVMQDGGGTGKSLFVSRVLTTLFGSNGVADNLSIEDVCGKFNSKLEGRAVWFVNETARGKYALDDLKRKVGSKSFWIEHKGVAPFEAQMTAWVIMAGNSVEGAVLLSGSEVDRRWSIVRGGRPLKALVAERSGMSEAAADAWVQREGQHIISNAQECGRWIGRLCEKHGDVTEVMALHGADYREVAEDQKSIEHRLFEAVFENENFDYIKRSTLYEMYTHFVRQSGRKPKARGTLYAELESWAAKRGKVLDIAAKKMGSGMTASNIFFIMADDSTISKSNRIDSDGDHNYIADDRATGKPSFIIDIG